MKKFINHETLKLIVTKIGDFNAYNDYHTEALFWDNGEMTIYASPEWEGNEGVVAIQVQKSDDLSDGYEYKMSNPFDLVSQEAEYICIISDIIDAVTNDKFKDLDSALSSVKSIESLTSIYSK